MRILITGSNGFVAQKFCELYGATENLFLGISKAPNRNKSLSSESFIQCDLNDLEKLGDILSEFRPTHILHAAAISSVEACVQNPELAKAVNIELTKFLGQYATNHHTHLTFLSTDFVFDGRQQEHYRETDKTTPINAYGKTKTEAEQHLLNLNSNIAILRTILVYGCIADTTRSNLVLWAKQQLETNKSIKVVNDQWRMPTWVDDLVRACFLSMEKAASGIFHISGGEQFSIESAVRQVADYWQLDQSLIQSISAKEIGQDQNRPQRTGFILDKAKTILGFTPTPFIVSLQKIEEQLKQYNR